MGYCVDQGETKFLIKAENKTKAHRAVHALLKKMPRYSWIDMGELAAAKTIEDQLEAFRWEAGTDEETGDVVDLLFRGEKLGDDELLLKTIAPFVESGSFIQMNGEDGACWRWCFVDGKLSEKSPTW